MKYARSAPTRRLRRDGPGLAICTVSPSTALTTGCRPVGLRRAYLSTSTTYRRIVFCVLSRWGARSVQAFDL
jgi:hypothetical protein